jgi:O-antigen ligase
VIARPPLVARRGLAPNPGLILPLGLALLAPALAAVGAVKPTYAAGAVLGVALLLAIAADVRVLPVLLTFTIFAEDVAIGHGFRVGRVAGALAIGLVVCYLLYRGRAGLRTNLLLVSVAVYGLWMLISFYWAAYQGWSTKPFLTYLLGVAYMFAFAILARRPRDLYAVSATLAAGAVFAGLIAIEQYVRHRGNADYRAVGLQGDPNYFAVYQVFALPLVLVLAARDPRRSRRVLLYGVLAVIALSVVASLSRTGLLAFVLVALVTLVLPRRIFFRDRRQKAMWIVALVLASMIGLSFGSARYVHRASTIFNTSSQGDRGSGRTDLWRAALHAWHDHPWFGLGAGNFIPQSLDLLQTTPGVDSTRPYIAADRPVHNAYLEQLVDLGVVGFVLYMVMLGALVRTLVIAYRRAKDVGWLAVERFGRALLIGLIVFLFGSFFLPTELAKPLFIAIGLALALDVMTRDLKPVPAVTVPLPEAPYSLAVREMTDDESVQARRAELRAEEERLERKRRAVTEFADELRTRALALAQREQRLVERERMLFAATATASPPAPAEPPAAASEPEYEWMEPVVDEPPRPEPVVAAPPPVEPEAVEEPEPEPVPEPVAEPEPEQRGVQEPAGALEAAVFGGRWHIATLERLNETFGAADPDRGYYVYYLADFADENGYLDGTFDSLVWDVFGELIERARNA